MEDWNLKRLSWRPHNPEILASGDDGRAISLDLPAGEMLQDHQVHEAAWILVVDGEVLITSQVGQIVEGRPGCLVQLAARERHEVRALSAARLLLMLTPWPGPGHPGAMTLEQKSEVRHRAAERAGRSRA